MNMELIILRVTSLLQMKYLIHSLFHAQYKWEHWLMNKPRGLGVTSQHVLVTQPCASAYFQPLYHVTSHITCK